MDNNVYFKRGRKYIPFGVRYDERYLPDGIWLVQHNEHSTTHTNVDSYLSGIYKLADNPQYVDVPKLCSVAKYADYILDNPEIKEMMNQGYTFYDLVHKIVALVVKLNDTIKEEVKKDGTR